MKGVLLHCFKSAPYGAAVAAMETKVFHRNCLI